VAVRQVMDQEAGHLSGLCIVDVWMSTRQHYSTIRYSDSHRA
jgi:hypothetical protein